VRSLGATHSAGNLASSSASSSRESTSTTHRSLSSTHTSSPRRLATPSYRRHDQASFLCGYMGDFSTRRTGIRMSLGKFLRRNSSISKESWGHHDCAHTGPYTRWPASRERRRPSPPAGSGGWRVPDRAATRATLL